MKRANPLRAAATIACVLACGTGADAQAKLFRQNVGDGVAQ